MAGRLPRLFRYVPHFLAAFLFIFYSYPLWSGMRLHRSIADQDRLHHGQFLLFLRGEWRDFLKYGIGAHVLDWPPAHVLYELTEPRPEFRDWHSPPVLNRSQLYFHYEQRTGRMSSWYHCLLGALCVSALYLILLPYLARGGALFAALVCGLQPAFVRHACNAGTNTPLVLFALLTLYAVERWRTRHSPAWAVAAGVFAACAFVNKEYFAFFLLPLPLLLWETAKKNDENFLTARTLWSGLAFAAAFLLATAAVSLMWLDPSLYLDHLKSYFTSIGALTVKRVSFWQPVDVPWWQYPLLVLAGIWQTSDSPPLALLAFVGLYFVFVPRAERIWLLAFPAATYFVFIPLRYNHLAYPYLFLCLPLAATAAAKSLVRALAAKNKFWPVAGTVLAAAGLLHFAATDVLMHRDMGDDVRVQAESFFRVRRCPPTYSVGVVDPGMYGLSDYGCGRLVALDPQAIVRGDKSPESPDYLVVSGEQLAYLRGHVEGLRDAPLAEAPSYLVARGKYELLHVYENRRPYLVYHLNGFNDPQYLFRRVDTAPKPD